MTAENILRQRLITQHACGETLSTPVDVVRYLGAIQAQDYLGGLWAVGLRAKTANESTVEKSLSNRSIIRTWPLRGTLHFVAADDARWMLGLAAPRVIARLTGRYRQLELEPAVFRRARTLFENALRGAGRLTRGQMFGLLRAARIPPEGQRGIHILQRLAQDGVLCFGPRIGKHHTFVLLDEWIPPTRPRARDEALGELALLYFRGHGPATARDFAWWSGLTIADATAGLDGAASGLGHEVFEGRHYWGPHNKSATARLTPAAVLLPPFDELLVAYRDRGGSLAPDDSHHLKSLLSPTIMVRGRIVGTWTRARRRDSVTIAPRFFAALDERDLSAIRSAARRYGAFVGARAILG